MRLLIVAHLHYYWLVYLKVDEVTILQGHIPPYLIIHAGGSVKFEDVDWSGGIA